MPKKKKTRRAFKIAKRMKARGFCCPCYYCQRRVWQRKCSGKLSPRY